MSGKERRWIAGAYVRQWLHGLRQFVTLEFMTRPHRNTYVYDDKNRWIPMEIGCDCGKIFYRREDRGAVPTKSKTPF